MAGKVKSRRKGARGDRAPSSVTVRHYCQGIGDCHLLKFTGKDGEPFHMLIDCGVHSSVSGGKDKIARIVDDIATVTKKIDVLVITHEHWDHISGFVTAAETFKQKLKIDAVWMGWTENPDDPQARRLDEFKKIALAALDGAQDALKTAGKQRIGDRPLARHLSALQDGLENVLGFHGVGLKGERVRSAREAAAALAPGKERYLEPGGKPIEVPGLPNLRVYVLGPPRDAADLGVRERLSEMYGLGGRGGWPMATALASAFGASANPAAPDEDWAAPFDPNVGANLTWHLEARPGTKFPVEEQMIATFLLKHYTGPADYEAPETKDQKRLPPAACEAPRIKGQNSTPPPAYVTDQSWRRIDHDWLGMSADLAIQLDDRTNNSSLVLAFEFVDSGRVLLFTGDAQVGSWLSWQKVKWKVGDKTVAGPDLLGRTVYYKVGHHGSHNATLKQKGLELMNDPDLSAFIPTNAVDAQNVHWGEMPFEKIVNELNRRTDKRLIRADDGWLKKKPVPSRFSAPSGSILNVKHQPDLWVELEIA